MNLHDAQKLLRRLIVAPQGVEAGLAELGNADQEIWESMLHGDQRLSAADRLDIYANMYFFRLRDSLREDFPALYTVLGAETFHNLITDYLLAHPPSHFSLRYAGQHLASFVGSHVVNERRPFVAALSRLEWSVLEAFDAADGPTLVADDLAKVPASAWGDLRFDLSPSLQLLFLDWPVQILWQQVQNEEPPTAISPAATCVRVWRREFRVYQRAVDLVEQTALTALREGAAFGDVCAAVAAAVGEEQAARQSSELLATWLADGLLSGWSR